jgi:predicted chitinase
MKLDKLMALSQGTSRPIDKLEKPQLAELQTALNILGYPAGDVDGLFGPRTRNAWAEFVGDTGGGDHTAIEGDWVAKLQKALDDVKTAPAEDFSTKAGTMKAIKTDCTRQGIVLPTQIAYVLATADHETNHTFKPVTEAYWLPNPDAYLKTHHPDYYPYYGRGYVQLTWKNNYAKYGQLLEKDLVGHPELALTPEIAVFVLVHGFKTGTFTGRKISDYVNAGNTDFRNARRCINGLDKADQIAQLARTHLAHLDDV